MTAINKVTSYLRHLKQHLGYHQMPLYSDLDQRLPLPDLKNVKVLWPNKYCWHGDRALEPLKKELSRIVPLELYDVEDKKFVWHEKGGFPVPHDKFSSIGKPKSPRGLYDIRGEIMEVHYGNHVIRCAYDYSDYDIVSSDILSEVDLYFKKVISSIEKIPAKVFSIGFYAINPNLLAKARMRFFKGLPERKIDVYARFGTWTDSQPMRQIIVDNLKNSSLNFTGGFTKRSYPEYLKELLQTKISIDAHGQAPASPRLLESMALGAVVVSPKYTCTFPEEIIDGIHYVAIKEDAGDLVETCRKLLENDDQLENIRKEAMIFFDHNFSTESMARRILREAINRSH